MIDATRLEQAKQAVIGRNKAEAVELMRRVLSEGGDPMEFLEKGFVPGITRVGECFGRGEMFLPELVTAADVMKAVMEVATEATQTEGSHQKGVVVIATVKGDVHDIGKSIVVSMLKANGYEVHDLGRDVDVDTIVNRAVDLKADVIGTSALLTTTMPEQRKLEETLKQKGLRDRFKTVVGGAPVTSRWASRIGADAYARDAEDGVRQIDTLLKGA